jgi:hypothetical protein
VADHPIPVALICTIIIVRLLTKVRSRQREPSCMNQVAAVSDQSISWERKKLLNHNEGLVYASARSIAEQVEPSWRVWPQVSLGEVVQTVGRTEADNAAFRWINSKRADFLVVDGSGWPLAVIEYQGRGHYRGNAAEPDAVKRTVLPRAGVRYIEVPAEMSKRRGQLDAHPRTEFMALAAAG